MSGSDGHPVELLVIGGGIAGLWTLDAAVRAGWNAVLVEAFELGRGQSVAAQGIIHGGLKYTLRERDLEAAGAIAEPHARPLRTARSRNSRPRAFCCCACSCSTVLHSSLPHRPTT